MPSPQLTPNRSFHAGRLRLLLLFLAATVLVRCLHISMIPSLLTGMNPAAAVSAKGVVAEGLTGLDPSKPPLPALLLAVPAWLLDVPPGQLIHPAVLVVSVAYAGVFWLWLRSLRLSRSVTEAACLTFVFLPMHNGYDGLDSIQTLLAGTVFLGLVTVFNTATIAKPRSVIVGATIAALCAMTLPLIRAEYLVFLPLLLAGHAIAIPLFRPIINLRRSALLAMMCFAGLGIGSAIEAGLRGDRADEIAQSRAEYACWTFLDGMPDAWLSPDDDTEFKRRTVGIQRFGHPSQFHWSLKAMVLANPTQTISKAVLSLPRWLLHLAGRSQILPRPAALLAATGLLILIIKGSSPMHRLRVVQLTGLILVTMPLAGFMIYSEYMRPAFPAMCVLMAYGVLSLSRLLHRVIRNIPRQTAVRVFALLTCAALEFFYFRSNAHYPDVPVFEPVAAAVDELLAGHPADRVLLDPYSAPLDSASRSRFENRILERADRMINEPDNTLALQDPDVFRLYRDASVKADEVWTIVVLAAGDSPDRMTNDNSRWTEAGFKLQATRVVRVSQDQAWTVGVFRNH